MNFIVTAGGTREKIDAVRTITNDATGKLGSLITEELSNRLVEQDHTIYYLCGAGSLLPNVDDSGIRVIRIESTEQLQRELSNLLTTRKIDSVIHSMAVSDYKVSTITTPDFIADSLYEKFRDSHTVPSLENWRNMIQEAFTNDLFDGKKKISSELEHPVLVLEKTPKIIGMIKKASPQTILVGFKLLSGVSEEKLIETAYNLLLKNQCDFVLANDKNSIIDGNHEGYLVDSGANFVKFSGKEQIAKGIVDSLLKKLFESAK